MKKHWYFVYVRECPICGKTKESRERKYTAKPQDWHERMIVRWKSCDKHWL
jgi:hypothetical protein